MNLSGINLSRVKFAESFAELKRYLYILAMTHAPIQIENSVLISPSLATITYKNTIEKITQLRTYGLCILNFHHH